MKKIFIPLILLSVTAASAQDSELSSAYSFGGSCSSQGVWTQNALQTTQTLRKITLQLRDDPNCQALGSSMQAAFNQLEEELNKSGRGQDPQYVRRMSQIPNEVAALRSYYTSSPEMKSQIMGLLMSRAVEGAAISAQVGGAAPNEATANLMRDFGQRTAESAKSGLRIFNGVVDTLPQLDQCLTDEGQQMVGNMMAGLVQVATSFASSGTDSTGGHMAQSISKIAAYMRNSRFSSVLRKLNQQEFQASMACLLELTSESYCQARDAMGLFNKGMADLDWKQELNGKINSRNPFIGYYVLNTHIPNITKWMQKIQIGVDPMLPTDAVFQNRIQQEVTDFYKGLKTLLGDYNSTLLTIKSLPNLEAKQNAVLKLIQNITESMLRGGATGYSSDDRTNFFTMTKIPLKIPFFLIGIDQVPDQVLGREKGLVKISYDDWLQANMSSLPMFQDPEALAETIGRNMRELAQSANVSVIEYFSKWYIVDKTALVNESLVDVNYTVKDSLIITRDYLSVAKERIEKYGGDYSRISMIMDTQRKIDLILERYKALAVTGKSLAKKIDAKNISDQDVAVVADEAAVLVKTVYEQFNVMQARSGFLANRLVNIVQYDYTLLIDNKVDFSEYQQEIFIATGMAGLDRMLQMFNGNPANIKTDLNMALNINKGNLEALSFLLKDNLIGLIAEKKMVAEDRNGSFGAAARDSSSRLMKDVFTDKYTHSNGWNFLPELFGPAGGFSAIGYWWTHSNRYPLTSKVGKAPQSEFGDAGAIRAQLCVQSLAFWNQTGLRHLCDDAVLKTPFVNLTGHDMAYNERLTSHLRDQGVSEQMKKSLNHSDRICAFRDYNRKNLVRFMSLNKREKKAFVSESQMGGQ